MTRISLHEHPLLVEMENRSRFLCIVCLMYINLEQKGPILDGKIAAYSIEGGGPLKCPALQELSTSRGRKFRQCVITRAF